MLRSVFPALACLALLISGLWSYAPDPEPIAVEPPHERKIEAHFSPHTPPDIGPEAAIIRELDAAKWDIKVQAYGFTSKPIADALIAAYGRKIIVEVVLDDSNLHDGRSQASRCRDAGIAVRFDKKHAIAHNKVMVIDERLTITGSWNLTESAEHRNAENIVILRSRPVAAEYLENWTRHKWHSEPAPPPEPNP